MTENEKKINKRYYLRLTIVFLVFCALIAVSALYINDYYSASDVAFEAIQDTDITIEEKSNEVIFFKPDNPTAGFIFYPGGKVEYQAYAPLMLELAKNDILCILIHMPGNLAVTNINAADQYRNSFPEITDWYIGGHSLGGSMASTLVSVHPNSYKGLALLGAYSASNISDLNIKVVSIYGENDGVMKRDKYEKYKSNLPVGFVEEIIPGGNHAYFGCYGEQNGDGVATIKNEQQIEITAFEILAMIRR